jgi:hypothetical protein
MFHQVLQGIIMFRELLSHLLKWPTKSECFNGFLVGSILGMALQVVFRLHGVY